MVWELEASNEVDLSPRFAADKSENPLLKPGETIHIATKNVNGDFGFGKSLRVFLYIVKNDTAYVNNNLTISYSNLSNKNFQIQIEDQDLHYPGVPTFE